MGTAISEHGIVPGDIYNFDETGFTIGLIATTKVIIGAETLDSKLIQPGQ